MSKSKLPVAFGTTTLEEHTAKLGITLPTGMFDFSPVQEEEEKLKQNRLEQMPKEDIPDLLDWTLKKRPFLIPGRKFDIEYHKYLVDLYRCKAKDVVVMKSSQAGVSEWLVSYAIHTCDQRNGNVLYVFPTETIVSDFSAARLGPAIEASEYLSKIIIGSGGGMRGSDRIMLKRIRNRHLYFRGAKVDVDGSSAQLKSVDADVLILDEVDEQDQRAPIIAKKRLGHAGFDLGNVLWVSTPTFPGYGIHAEYLETDQKQWFIACPHCGEKQSLSIENVVLEWDALNRPAVWNGQEDYDAWAACIKCGKKLNRLSDGEWVAEFPSRSREGFHLTKFFSPFSNIPEIVNDLQTVDETKRREAWNQDLGLPYTPKGGSLTSEDLDQCRREYLHGPDHYSTCYMGIDVGSVLNVVVRTGIDLVHKENRQLYAGESTWAAIHNLIKIYNPKTIVIDALPETTEARRLQDEYATFRVWIAYYPTHPVGTKKDEYVTWNLAEKVCMIDRTRAMDAMFAGFYGHSNALPAHARNIPGYYDQMRAPIKVEKEIGSTGVKVSTFIDNRRPDHYAHAETYAHIASLCRMGMGWTQGAAS